MYGRVHGVALGVTAHRGIARIDVGEVSAAFELGENIAAFLCALDAGGHVFLDLRIGVEVAVDQFLGFAARDAESLRKAEGGDAVDDAEVGGFGLAALIARHLFDGLVEDARGGSGVDVVAGVEVGDHVLVAAEVCHDAQLDLRIVGAEEGAILVGHEGFANLAAVFSANGDVLQVGVRRRKATGGCNCLIEGSVDATGACIDELREGFDVGGEEFLERAVCQNLLHDGVLVAQRLEYFFGGGVLSGFRLPRFFRNLQFFKKYGAHLLR